MHNTLACHKFMYDSQDVTLFSISHGSILIAVDTLTPRPPRERPKPCLRNDSARLSLAQKPARTTPLSSTKKTVFTIYRTGNRTGNPDGNRPKLCGWPFRPKAVVVRDLRKPQLIGLCRKHHNRWDDYQAPSDLTFAPEPAILFVEI